MGIFARLAALIKSNLNDLISRSEDPEKMLNQIVEEMSTQLLEAKRQVAESIADEKRLAKQAEHQAYGIPAYASARLDRLPGKSASTISANDPKIVKRGV